MWNISICGVMLIITEMLLKKLWGGKVVSVMFQICVRTAVLNGSMCSYLSPVYPRLDFLYAKFPFPPFNGFTKQCSSSVQMSKNLKIDANWHMKYVFWQIYQN